LQSVGFELNSAELEQQNANNVATLNVFVHESMRLFGQPVAFSKRSTAIYEIRLCHLSDNKSDGFVVVEGILNQQVIECSFYEEVAP
jgi:hypothetical protein